MMVYDYGGVQMIMSKRGKRKIRRKRHGHDKCKGLLENRIHCVEVLNVLTIKIALTLTFSAMLLNFVIKQSTSVFLCLLMQETECT